MSSEETTRLISAAEVLSFLRRRALAMVLGVSVCAFLGFKCSGFIPRSYRAKATITIHASYFHHPLASDVLPEIQETADRTFERAAIVRLALNDQFLTEFAAKYFPRPTGSYWNKPPIDFESTLKNIDYFATNPTSFQIAVTTSSPETAFRATEDIVRQVTTTISRQRFDQLAKTQQAMIHQAELLADSLSYGAPDKNSESLEALKASTERKLSLLASHLTDNHPDLVSMRGRLNQLRSTIKDKSSQTSNVDTRIPGVFLLPKARNTTQEIFDELLKKISNLEVLLTMERKQVQVPYLTVVELPRIPTHPIAPNRVVFLLIGSAFGLVSVLSVSIIWELRVRSTITLREAGAFLELPILGELPTISPPFKTSSGIVDTYSYLFACLALNFYG